MNAMEEWIMIFYMHQIPDSNILHLKSSWIQIFDKSDFHQSPNKKYSSTEHWAQPRLINDSKTPEQSADQY